MQWLSHTSKMRGDTELIFSRPTMYADIVRRGNPGTAPTMVIVPDRVLRAKEDLLDKQAMPHPALPPKKRSRK